MKSPTRSRKPASIGSNHSSRRPTAISASEPRTGNFVLLLVMAWSPPAHNAAIVWVSAPGDYATFNSNHTPDGTKLACGTPPCSSSLPSEDTEARWVRHTNLRNQVLVMFFVGLLFPNGTSPGMPCRPVAEQNLAG